MKGPQSPRPLNPADPFYLRPYIAVLLSSSASSGNISGCRRCCRPLAGGGQGRCSVPHRAQDGPTTENDPAPRISRAEAGDPLPGSAGTWETRQTQTWPPAIVTQPPASSSVTHVRTWSFPLAEEPLCLIQLSRDCQNLAMDRCPKEAFVKKGSGLCGHCLDSGMCLLRLGSASVRPCGAHSPTKSARPPPALSRSPLCTTGPGWLSGAAPSLLHSCWVTWP